jgi:hypothetical protein
MKKLSVFLCAMVLVFGLGVTVHAFSNNQYSRATLRGLRSSRILVKVVHHDGKSIESFKAAITEDLETRLRIGRIHIDRNSNNSIQLFITIIEVPKASENFIYLIEISVFQEGRLMRNEKSGIHDVCTWSSGYHGLCHSMTKIRDNVRDQIDVFIKAHNSVNPRNFWP